MVKPHKGNLVACAFGNPVGGARAGGETPPKKSYQALFCCRNPTCTPQCLVSLSHSSSSQSAAPRIAASSPDLGSPSCRASYSRPRLHHVCREAGQLAERAPLARFQRRNSSNSSSTLYKSQSGTNSLAAASSALPCTQSSGNSVLTRALRERGRELLVLFENETWGTEGAASADSLLFLLLFSSWTRVACAPPFFDGVRHPFCV
jgi:hypothetical protein